MRTNLRALLEQGINPLSFFDRDYKKVSSSSSLAIGGQHSTACRRP